MAADLFSTLLYALSRKEAQREARNAQALEASWRSADVASQMAQRDIAERQMREKEAAFAGEQAQRAGQPAPISEDPRLQQLIEMGTSAALAAEREAEQRRNAEMAMQQFRADTEAEEAQKGRWHDIDKLALLLQSREGIAAGQNAARVAAAGRRSAGAGLDPYMVNLEKTARTIQNQLNSRLKLLGFSPMTKWEAVDDPEIQELGTQLNSIKNAMAQRVSVPLQSSQAPQAQAPVDDEEEAFLRSRR